MTMKKRKKMITEVRESHFVELKNVMRKFFLKRNGKKETKALKSYENVCARDGMKISLGM